MVLLAGVGIAGGCQARINAQSAVTYPPAIRSTGSWALGVGRVGTIAGAAGRCAVGARISGAENIRHGRHPCVRSRAVNGDSRAIAAPHVRAAWMWLSDGQQ